MFCKTQNLNFFTFAIRLAHNSIKGSLDLKHVHQLCVLALDCCHTWSIHIRPQGDLLTAALNYHWLAFNPIIQETVIIAG